MFCSSTFLMRRLSQRMILFILPISVGHILTDPLSLALHFQVPSSKDVEPLDLCLLRRPIDPFSVPMVAQTPPIRARDHFSIQSTTGARRGPLPLPAVSPSLFLA